MSFGIIIIVITNPNDKFLGNSLNNRFLLPRPLSNVCPHALERGVSGEVPAL